MNQQNQNTQRASHPDSNSQTISHRLVRERIENTQFSKNGGDFEEFVEALMDESPFWKAYTITDHVNATDGGIDVIAERLNTTQTQAIQCKGGKQKISRDIIDCLSGKTNLGHDTGIAVSLEGISQPARELMEAYNENQGEGTIRYFDVNVLADLFLNLPEDAQNRILNKHLPMSKTSQKHLQPQAQAHPQTQSATQNINPSQTAFKTTEPLVSNLPDTEAAATITSLADNLRSAAESVDGIPTNSQLEAHGLKARTLRNTFGSVGTALMQAGISPAPSNRNTPTHNEQLLFQLTAITTAVPEGVTRETLDTYARDPVTKFTEEFNTWDCVLAAAGDPEAFPEKGTEYSSQELFLDYARIEWVLGEKPSIAALNAFAVATPGTYTNHFNSIQTVTELTETAIEMHSLEDYKTLVSLIEDAQQLNGQIQGSLTSEKMHDKGTSSPSSYANHFGTWVKGLLWADIPLSSKQSDRSTCSFA